MKVTKEEITRQLEELAPGAKYKLRLNGKLPVRLSIRVTDDAVSVQVNPKRCRSDAQLQEAIAEIAQELVRSVPMARVRTEERRDGNGKEDVPATHGGIGHKSPAHPRPRRRSGPVQRERLPTVVAVQRAKPRLKGSVGRSSAAVGARQQVTATGQAALF